MATVETDFDLYLCAQGGKTTDKYCNIFAFIIDMINVNGGNAGLDPSVFKKYFKPMKDKGVKELGKELIVHMSSKLKAIE